MARPARLWATLLALCVACTGSPVRVQARAATATARAFNGLVRPTILDAFEADCRARVHAACAAPPCTREVIDGAWNPCDREWAGITSAYDALAEVHARYATRLEACGADAGASCVADLGALEQALLRAATVYRCRVRAAHHPELDPVPGAPPACPDPGDAS